jgi:hypothetical protein
VLGIVVLHGYLILIMVFGAWSRRPLLLAVSPLAAPGNMLAGTKDGIHQAASALWVVLLQPITVISRLHVLIN